MLLVIAYITVAERKTMASMQRRLGPNSVGFEVFNSRIDNRKSNQVAYRMLFSTSVPRTRMVRSPICLVNRDRELVLKSKSQRAYNFPLQPSWVTGFTDGEGCFYVSINKNKELKIGLRIQLVYEIGLKEKDLPILEQIYNIFSVGSIAYKAKTQSFHYKLQSPSDLQIIINHFKQFSLITQKQADFKLFLQVYYLILAKEHLTENGLRQIIAIKASINRGLPDVLK